MFHLHVWFPQVVSISERALCFVFLFTSWPLFGMRFHGLRGPPGRGLEWSRREETAAPESRWEPFGGSILTLLGAHRVSSLQGFLHT